MPTPARPFALLPLLVAPALAQGPPPGALSENPVPDLVSALSFLSLEESISAASFRVDNDDPLQDDTRFKTLKLPWEQDFDVGSERGTLFVEASVGWLTAEDFTAVPTPMGEVTLAQDWELFAGKLGVGWTFPLGEHWKLRPGLAVALSRTENEARYNELGEELLAPEIDGVLVNFEAWALTTAGSLTLLHERELGEVELNARARYTYAWTDVFDATDPFQEQSDGIGLLSVRADLQGPLYAQAWGRPLRWKSFLGYAALFDSTESVLGFDHLFELGLGLVLPLPKVPYGLELSGAALFGDDIQGSALGLSVAF